MRRIAEFDAVLEANKNYVEALDRMADASEQIALLDICRELLEKNVLAVGRGNEYHDYCMEIAENED